MPNIKPVSDLRSYTAVLDEVAKGSPVFLTKNGRGRYVILDIADYERTEAEQVLLAQLDYGRRVADGREGAAPPNLEDMQVLYGPPSMFDPSGNEAVALYGPPEMFSPQDNENEDLYGPPPFFGEPDEGAAGKS